MDGLAFVHGGRQRFKDSLAFLGRKIAHGKQMIAHMAGLREFRHCLAGEDEVGGFFLFKQVSAARFVYADELLQHGVIIRHAKARTAARCFDHDGRGQHMETKIQPHKAAGAVLLHEQVALAEGEQAIHRLGLGVYALDGTHVVEVELKLRKVKIVKRIAIETADGDAVLLWRGDDTGMHIALIIHRAGEDDRVLRQKTNGMRGGAGAVRALIQAGIEKGHQRGYAGDEVRSVILHHKKMADARILRQQIALGQGGEERQRRIKCGAEHQQVQRLVAAHGAEKGVKRCRRIVPVGMDMQAERFKPRERAVKKHALHGPSHQEGLRAEAGKLQRSGQIADFRRRNQPVKNQHELVMEFGDERGADLVPEDAGELRSAAVAHFAAQGLHGQLVILHNFAQTLAVCQRQIHGVAFFLGGCSFIIPNPGRIGNSNCARIRRYIVIHRQVVQHCPAGMCYDGNVEKRRRGHGAKDGRAARPRGRGSPAQKSLRLRGRGYGVRGERKGRPRAHKPLSHPRRRAGDDLLAEKQAAEDMEGQAGRGRQ